MQSSNGNVPIAVIYYDKPQLPPIGILNEITQLKKTLQQ